MDLEIKLAHNSLFWTEAGGTSMPGNKLSNSEGVKYGPLHYRNLERNKISALKSTNGDFDKPMTLTSSALQNITCWRTHVDTAFKEISHANPSVTICTDASKSGWGATVDKRGKCNEITKSIWDWANTHNTWLTASYIPGVFNTEADYQSRKNNTGMEWKLSENIYTQVLKYLSSRPVNCDLSIQELTWKLATLMALLSAQRA
eukprot:gene13323-14697_t